jgi:hypothetical protein
MTNVYVRLIVYVLSAFLGQIPAIALGWFSYQLLDGMIHVTISLEGAATALLTAVGISGGVFKVWGTK